MKYFDIWIDAIKSVASRRPKYARVSTSAGSPYANKRTFASAACPRSSRRGRTGWFAFVLPLLLTSLPFACKSSNPLPHRPPHSGTSVSREAFLKAYPVFMHPRCMNCHPDGDAPLQGDDSHTHLQNVQRGADGKGLYALKCRNCHQDTNLPGQNMPPGHPNWHLPPAQMRMVFQGKTPTELARQLKDPAQNGGKTLDEIFRHVAEDSLVLTGWNPADGLSKPPLSHEEFSQAMRDWIDNGAAIPN